MKFVPHGVAWAVNGVCVNVVAAIGAGVGIATFCAPLHAISSSDAQNATEMRFWYAINVTLLHLRLTPT
jgi:hypothetical protein